jgi:Transposase DDE domain group 1
VNGAWLTASMTGQILLAWLKLLALDGDLARAEPKTLRRVLHAAARLVRSGRRRRLKIQASWPWAEAITAAWQRIGALPQAPDQPEAVPAIQEGQPLSPWNPRPPGPTSWPGTGVWGARIPYPARRTA